MSKWANGLRAIAASLAIGVGIFGAAPSLGADILSEWPHVKMPQAPELKPVSLDGKTTALLILDMQAPICTVRPRCVESIPKVKALMDGARAAGALVAYSLGSGKVVDSRLAPHEGEVFALRPLGADKFLGSDLAQRLKDRGVHTVIICGTSAQGVGIGTGSAAAQRGYKVIYPVDCVSSEDAFRELYAAYHMSGGGPPVVTKSVTVTRSDMIRF